MPCPDNNNYPQEGTPAWHAEQARRAIGQQALEHIRMQLKGEVTEPFTIEEEPF